MSSEHGESKRVGVGVAVIVSRATAGVPEVLLVQRRYHGHGSWCPPGGYIDPGERPEESAAREVREESGLAVTGTDYLCLTNDIHDDGKHNVTLWFSAEVDDPDAALVMSDESIAIGWFPWDDLPSPRYLTFRNYLEGRTYPAGAGGPVSAA